MGIFELLERNKTFEYQDSGCKVQAFWQRFLDVWLYAVLEEKMWQRHVANLVISEFESQDLCEHL